MRQVTIADLQRRERQLSPQKAIAAWLMHDTDFNLSETVWGPLLLALRVQDGSSILELTSLKSSLITMLSGGVYYENIGGKPDLVALQQAVYPEGVFREADWEGMLAGEPLPGYSLVVATYGSYQLELDPAKLYCYEPTDGEEPHRPYAAGVRIQVGTKALLEGGYLLIVGEIPDGLFHWLKKRLQIRYHGFAGDRIVLIAQKVAGRIGEHALFDNQAALPGNLPPVPIASQDPRPLALEPWRIETAKPRPYAAQTELVKVTKRLEPRFANPLDAQMWAGAVLENQHEPSWMNAQRSATDKLEPVNYLRLRREGRSLQAILGLPEGWPIRESVGAAAYLKKLQRRLDRNLLSYPVNAGPESQYYALGPGAVIRDAAGVPFEVTFVEALPNEQPRLHVRPLRSEGDGSPLEVRSGDPPVRAENAGGTDPGSP